MLKMTYYGFSKALFFSTAFICLSSCRLLDAFETRIELGKSSRPGVVFYDQFRAQPGYNLINDGESSWTPVLAMNGEEVGVLPGAFPLFLPDNQYFSSDVGPSLYDSEFRVIWSQPKVIVAHEAIYDEDRDWIWILSFDRVRQGKDSLQLDKVMGLSRKDGKIEFEWRPEQELKTLELAAGRKLEFYQNPTTLTKTITHLNSISILPHDVEGVGKKGDLLLSDFGSSRLLYLLNPETKKIVKTWSTGTNGRRQLGSHSALFLPSDEILFFINNSDDVLERFHLGFSFITRLDAKKGTIHWNYTATPPQALNSKINGNVQLLENGNYLISHQNNPGGAFEITSKGRIVWEWNNDRIDTNKKPYPVYRVLRASPDRINSTLKSWKKMSGGL